MGHFSYVCKHCDRPIHDPQTTWRGLNEWMATTVVLMSNGSTIMGEYDGYGRVADMEVYEAADQHGGAVWAHKACWKHAGKPDFDEYTGPSGGCQHGGHDEKDLLPEPGKPFDQATWDAALQDRADALRATLVEKALKMVNDGAHENKHGDHVSKPWSRRFQVYHYDGKYQRDPENPEPTGWVWYDAAPDMGGYDDVKPLRDDPDHGPQIQSGGTCETEAEATAECQTRWEAFLASDELAQMKRERAIHLAARGTGREQEILVEGGDRYTATEYGPNSERLEALIEEKSRLSQIDKLDDEQVARLGEINGEIDKTPRWGVYDCCDYTGEDSDEDDSYLLTGAPEADAKALAAKLNREWRHG
jgi:hypothetical protein